MLLWLRRTYFVLGNEKKISFAFLSFSRNFANKLAKLLQLGIKNK